MAAAGLGASLWPALGAAEVTRIAAADIPIQMLYRRPWTGVWLEKQGPFRFEIDTSSNFFAIWERLAERLKLQALPSGNAQIRRDHDRQYSTLYRVDEVLIGAAAGLTRVPMGSFTEEGEPAFVGGLPLLPDRVTAFEFGRGLMRYLPDDKPAVSDYAGVDLTYNRSNYAWSPEVNCRLGGKALKLYVDTATTDAVTLYPDTVKRLGLWDAAGPSYDRVDLVGGTPFKTRVARRGDLELGAVRLADPVITLHDPRNSLLSGINTDGTIGMEVLRRMDLVIDHTRRNFWIRPLPNVGEPWSQDRAGFGVDFRDGVQKIVQVDAGSPAAGAGLQEGDVLKDFTPEAVLRLHEAQCGRPGSKLTFDVERAGATQRVSMVLQDRV